LRPYVRRLQGAETLQRRFIAMFFRRRLSALFRRRLSAACGLIQRKRQMFL